MSDDRVHHLQFSHDELLVLSTAVDWTAITWMSRPGPPLTTQEALLLVYLQEKLAGLLKAPT